MGMLSAITGMLLPIPGLSLRSAYADLICPVPGVAPPIGLISPPTRPWIEEMPRLVEKQTVDGNSPSSFDVGNGGGAPAPTPIGTDVGGDSKIRCLQDFPSLGRLAPYEDLSHQAWGKAGPLGDIPPQNFYELRERQFNHVWHSDLPAGTSGQPAWGFDGLLPGPMFRSHYGSADLVRIHNDLPATNLGFGINQTSTHLHNMHTPAESDGNPLLVNYSGHYYDHHYPNLYAGVKALGGLGDPNEALGTSWYHDHKLDFTAQNIYAGLFGMKCIYDAPGIYADSTMGDYGDPNEATGWRLPCGNNYEFDVGLVFHDRQFDTNGVDFFPLTCFDGAIGDKVSVNGKIQPYFPVKRRKYRFRMLNIGPSRFYNWFLSNGKPFVVIANDGNLLPKPVRVKNFAQSPAERYDVIVDFSEFAPGTEIVLFNYAEQTDGRRPTGKLLKKPMQVLKFIVTSDAVVDNSIIPTTLRPLPLMDQPVSNNRTWVFKRNGGEWTINGNSFDRNTISATIQEGSAEKWALVNGGGGWAHPIHTHFEEARILSMKGRGIEEIEKGRKDVIRLEKDNAAEIYIRFRDFKGVYPVHCHNTVHEDHAMMLLFKVV